MSSKPPTRHARKKPMRLEAKARREAELRRARRRRNAMLYGSVGLAIAVAAIGVGFLVNRGENPSAQAGAAAGSATTVAPTTTAAPAPTDARADAPTAPEAVACGAKTPRRVQHPTFASKPATVIKAGYTYDAELRTSCGSFTIRLDAKGAPETVNSIVFLARKKFYDSTWFHRIVPGGTPDQIGVIQGGDPTGAGNGSAGYVVPDEFPESASVYKKYTVAMANAGPGTTGTQFFINFQDNAKGLAQPLYTLIGQVVKGTDVVDKIAKTPTAGANGDTPTEAVWIERMIIHETKAP
jgi:cyclophilin family peptidyl-prolyl cis-trans isomerase